MEFSLKNCMTSFYLGINLIYIASYMLFLMSYFTYCSIYFSLCGANKITDRSTKSPTYSFHAANCY